MALPAMAEAGEKTLAGPDFQLDGCRVTIYQGKGSTGESWTTDQGWADVGDHWAGKIASIKVEQGVWRFFTDAAYGGSHQDLTSYDEIDTGGRYIASVGSFICIESQRR